MTTIIIQGHSRNYFLPLMGTLSREWKDFMIGITILEPNILQE
jgi:hypothetical protein